MDKKIRLYFPLVEAGFGHIMPSRSIKEAFEQKYGNDKRIEIIQNRFFKESGDEELIKFEAAMIKNLQAFQKNPAYGHAMGVLEATSSPKQVSFFSMRTLVPGSFDHMIKRMEDINPDVVVSTHWSTNYIAMHMDDRPFSILYATDAFINALFLYECDLRTCFTQAGVDEAAKRKFFADKNVKLVPFAIRPEAFEISRDKIELRKKLGLPENKFTIIMVEGAYGNGKLKKICEKIAMEDIDITIIAICGKNPSLVAHLCSLQTNPKVFFKPMGFCSNILEYISASDLYLGKSGSGIFEPNFFNVPIIVTSKTNLIEKNNAKYFAEDVGSAIIETNPDKIAELIVRFANNPELLSIYKENSLRIKDNYGAEKTADLIYQTICDNFFKE